MVYLIGGKMKKYEMIKEGNYFRIKALKDFGEVKKGDIGGFIESDANLSQRGKCWVYGNAEVYNNAVVCNNAKIIDYAVVCNEADIRGNAVVKNNAMVCSNSIIKSTVKDTSCYAVLGVFGEYNMSITFQDKNKVAYGDCFYGTIDKFIEEVRIEYGNDYGSFARAIKILRLLEEK